MDRYEKKLAQLAQNPVTNTNVGDGEEGWQSWRREQVRAWLATNGEKAAEILMEVWETMDGEEWDHDTLFRVARAFQDAGLQMVVHDEAKEE